MRSEAEISRAEARVARAGDDFIAGAGALADLLGARAILLEHDADDALADLHRAAETALFALMDALSDRRSRTGADARA